MEDDDSESSSSSSSSDEEDDKNEPTQPPVVVVVASSLPFTVASIDFGENANATVIGTPFSAIPRISKLFLATLGPISGARDAMEAMRKQLADMPRCDLYLLEEQPLINPKTPLLEAAASEEAMRMGAAVIHVPVSRVASFFELPKKHAPKKTMATNIAKKLIDGTRTRVDGSPMLLVSEYAIVGFEMLKRKHDVADALLQFMWYANAGHRELGRGKPTFAIRATDPKNKAAERRRETKKTAQKIKAASALVYKRQRKTTKPPPPKRRRINLP